MNKNIGIIIQATTGSKRLPKKILNMLKSSSENVHNKMDCNCVSRLDFRYSAENETIL